jgi:malonate decarboxylase beta subunit
LRAVCDARAAGIPVVSLIGGANGCFGGMGIVARCTNFIIMSEEGRLAMSGPEVIESANGVEEFDSRDRALVWRTTGGKHRYLLGDCDAMVADSFDAFRAAAIEALKACAGKPASLTLEALEQEQSMLSQRLERFGAQSEPMDIWRALGIAEPASVPMLDAERFVELVAGYRPGAH